MSKPLYLCSFASALLMSVSLAGAQEAAPSTEDIVTFFAGADGTSKTRGICVGTAGECEKPETVQVLNMSVEFEYNSATLTQASDANLRRFSQALLDKRLVEMPFSLEGHTDASGSASYNQTLSQRRADAVKARLIELGVSESRLKALGHGETKPKFGDPYAPGNRRVEISMGRRDG